MVLTAIWHILTDLKPYTPNSFLESRPVNKEKVLTTSQAPNLLKQRGYLIKDDLFVMPKYILYPLPFCFKLFLRGQTVLYILYNFLSFEAVLVCSIIDNFTTSLCNLPVFCDDYQRNQRNKTNR